MQPPNKTGSMCQLEEGFSACGPLKETLVFGRRRPNALLVVYIALFLWSSCLRGRVVPYAIPLLAVQKKNGV